MVYIEILKHVKEDQQLVLEVVRTDGSVLEDSYEGRHMNPGHAIEARWFAEVCPEKEGR